MFGQRQNLTDFRPKSTVVRNKEEANPHQTWCVYSTYPRVCENHKQPLQRGGLGGCRGQCLARNRDYYTSCTNVRPKSTMVRNEEEANPHQTWWVYSTNPSVCENHKQLLQRGGLGGSRGQCLARNRVYHASSISTFSQIPRW